MDYVKVAVNYAEKSIMVLRPQDWFAAGILAVIVASVAARLRKRAQINICQAIALVLLVTYIFLVFSSTVFSRHYTGVHSYRLLPFWSYREIYKEDRMELLVENLLNVILLMPVGFLLPVISRRMKLRHIILVAFVMSYTIEVLQLIFCKGLFEWVDDPFHNVLGAAAGYAVAFGFHCAISQKEP